MIKKSLRKAAVGTIAAGALIFPTAGTIAPQTALMACNYPDSIVTQTDILAPSVIRPRTRHRAFINVDAGGIGPNGKVRFIINRGKARWKTVRDGDPVKFTFGKRFRANRNYNLRAKFFGNCRFRNSSDQLVVTVIRR